MKSWLIGAGVFLGSLGIGLTPLLFDDKEPGVPPTVIVYVEETPTPSPTFASPSPESSESIKPSPRPPTTGGPIEGTPGAGGNTGGNPRPKVTGTKDTD